jgi:pimeloyl-ACP methyl ester carboxylesterase
MTAIGAPPREEHVTIAGCSTFLRRAGGGGPPLLYLHGGRGGGWPPMLQRLARRFAVMAPDHPGFGRSATPDWFDNIHDVAYFYLDLVKALDLRGVHLVGASLGGWIAAEMAVRSTARVASLTLIGPWGIHVKGVEKPDVFLWTPEEQVRALFHDQRFAEAELAQEQAQGEEAALDRRLKNQFALARLAWAPRGFDPHLEKWLHRIDVPTLVAWGRHDGVIPVAYAARWGELLPRAEVLVLEDCGHAPQVERAETLADAIEEFTGRIPG